MVPPMRRIISVWYGICQFCLGRYPELQLTFNRISDLPDDVDDMNHKTMFDLIEHVRSEHKWKSMS